MLQRNVCRDHQTCLGPAPVTSPMFPCPLLCGLYNPGLRMQKSLFAENRLLCPKCSLTGNSRRSERERKTCTILVSFILAALSLDFSDTVIYDKFSRCAFMQCTYTIKNGLREKKHALLKIRMNV